MRRARKRDVKYARQHTCLCFGVTHSYIFDIHNIYKIFWMDIAFIFVHEHFVHWKCIYTQCLFQHLSHKVGRIDQSFLRCSNSFHFRDGTRPPITLKITENKNMFASFFNLLWCPPFHIWSLYCYITRTVHTKICVSICVALIQYIYIYVYCMQVVWYTCI